MNIYLIKRNTHGGYDFYDSYVCAAASEQEALEMGPEGEGLSPVYYNPWVVSIDDLSIEKIGVSDSDKACVILASFNAEQS